MFIVLHGAANKQQKKLILHFESIHQWYDIIRYDIIRYDTIAPNLHPDASISTPHLHPIPSCVFTFDAVCNKSTIRFAMCLTHTLTQELLSKTDTSVWLNPTSLTETTLIDWVTNKQTQSQRRPQPFTHFCTVANSRIVCSTVTTQGAALWSGHTHAHTSILSGKKIYYIKKSYYIKKIK